MTEELTPDDLVDDALGRALRDTAPAPQSPDPTLAALRPRFARAERRRRAVVAGGLGLAVLLIVGGSLVSLGSIDGGSVRTPPATRPDGPTVTTAPEPHGTEDHETPSPATMPGSAGPGGTTATPDDHGGSSGSSGSGDTGPGGTTATTDDHSGSGGSGDSGSGGGSGSSGSGDSGHGGSSSGSGHSGGSGSD